MLSLVLVESLDEGGFEQLTSITTSAVRSGSISK